MRAVPFKMRRLPGANAHRKPWSRPIGSSVRVSDESLGIERRLIKATVDDHVQVIAETSEVFV